MELTQAQLVQNLHYDPLTGVFTRLQYSHRSKVGTHPGLPHKSSRYMSIGVGQHVYLAHRLAWFYVHGVWPAGEIDHINGDRTDNRIANLRVVTRTENLQNRATGRSLSGLLGVSERPNGRFMARIRIDGDTEYIGTYDTADEAHAAYLSRKAQVHRGFVPERFAGSPS